MTLLGKGAQQRVDETVAFIVGNVAAAQRATVKTFLEMRIRTMVGSGPIRGLSDPMSMNDLADRGSSGERQMRRSIILIENVAVSAAPGATLAKALPIGSVAARFTALLDPLTLLADQACGSGAVLQARFNELVANPTAFLTRNMVTVFGSNTRGRMTQYFVYEYGLGSPKYRFFPVAQPDKPHCLALQVVNVPAVLWSKVPGRTNDPARGSFATITGTELTGASLMVTTQFSGCVFCFKEQGGRVDAAHIWPDDSDVKNSAIPGTGGDGSGTRLAKQLAGLEAPAVTAGDFAAPAPAGGAVRVYGPAYSNVTGKPNGYPPRAGNDWMTLLGFLRPGGQWEFVSQRVKAGAIAPGGPDSF